MKIIKELTALGFEGLKSSRSESKNLDADKIDIAETIPNTLPFYVQCKCTKNKPSYQDIIPNCPRKDRPLVIFHNYQVNKEVNMGSIGEYVIMTKEFFYNLIKATKGLVAFFIIMTKEQRETIENQIESHRSIIEDLLTEICYHENEIKNLETLLNDDSKIDDAVSIRHNNQ